MAKKLICFLSLVKIYIVSIIVFIIAIIIIIIIIIIIKIISLLRVDFSLLANQCQPDNKTKNYIKLTTILRKLHENINSNTILHKGYRHNLVSKDDLILIISGALLQILGAIYDTVSVSYLDVLGFLE